MRQVINFVAIVVVGFFGACLRRSNVQCEQNANCDLSSTGVCVAAPSGDQWCAYPASDCPSGLRYSTQAVGDGLSGACVAMPTTGPGPGSGSGDGQIDCKLRIAFESGQFTPFQSMREVWVGAPDGTELVNVSKAPVADNGEPSWAPDGTKLAFSSNRSGHYHIYVVNADGSNLMDLTPSLTENATTPSWSPDGARIAFVRGGNNWLMNADGTGQLPLPMQGGMPLVWSPDGQTVASEFYATGANNAITVSLLSMPVSATSPTASNRVNSADGFFKNYAWAPSKRLVWVLNQDVYTANGDGTQQVNATNYASSHSTKTPRVTTDGETIVYATTNNSENFEIWSVPAAGGTPTPVTHNTLPSAAGDSVGDISLDGTLVAFTRRTGIFTDSGSFDNSVGIINIHGTGETLIRAQGSIPTGQPVFSRCAKKTSGMLTLNRR